MADNVTLNPGTGGATVASDDIGGVQYQRVKIAVGADGAAADVHAGNPLPVREDHASTTASGPITSASAFATIGYGSLNATVPAAGTFQEIDTSSLSAVIVTVTGTWTAGTLNFEATSDGTNWFTVHGLVPGPTNSNVVFSLAAQGYVRLDVATYAKLRVRAVSTVTGLSGVTVHFRGTSSPATNPTVTRAIGSVAAGLGSTDNPILIAGRDPSNKVQYIPASPFGVPGLNISESIMSGAVLGRAGRATGRVTTAALGRVAIRNLGGVATFNEQTSGAQRAVKSSSVADTNVAGTGVRSITIMYYTLSAGVIAGPFFETVNLAGVVPVLTVATNIAYVEQMWALTVGSGGVAAGNIDLTADTLGLGAVVARIPAAMRSTQYVHHYVPSGETFLLTAIHYANSAATGNVALLDVSYRNPTASNSAHVMIAENLAVQGSTGTRHFAFTTPRLVTGPAIVEAHVTPENTASQTTYCEYTYAEV